MKNPKLIVKPFAKNGQKNVIPENYETSMDSNQATWDQGFGQITMLPVAAGGLPPKGQDFNGILNQISENIVYQSQGGRFKFSPEYAESIGGYPKGAILQSDDEKKEYQSLIDNNKVNFNTESNISTSWELVGAKYAIKNEVDLALLKKFDKENISVALGNDNNKVPSLGLLTTEVGKLQPKGNYQPAGDYATNTALISGLAGKQPVGDYATNTALTNGLGQKLNTSSVVQSTGSSTTQVMSQAAVTNLADRKLDKSLTYEITADAVLWNQQHAFTQVGFGEVGMKGKRGWIATDGISLNTDGTGFKSVGWPAKSGTMLVSADVAQSPGSSTSLTMSQKSVTEMQFGVGRDYVDVTSSRAKNTVYRNTEKFTIFVIVSTAITTTTNSIISAYVNDREILNQFTGGGDKLSKTTLAPFPVPPGASYKITSDSQIQIWMEMR